jgi:hypothetical protein
MRLFLGKIHAPQQADEQEGTKAANQHLKYLPKRKDTLESSVSSLYGFSNQRATRIGVHQYINVVTFLEITLRENDDLVLAVAAAKVFF